MGRVVGGFTEHQFVEKRLPTIDELNAAAPDTPVFILHLYDRALLNAAALRVVGYTKDTPEPPGGTIVRDAAGNPTGLLLANPNATILYATHIFDGLDAFPTHVTHMRDGGFVTPPLAWPFVSENIDAVSASSGFGSGLHGVALNWLREDREVRRAAVNSGALLKTRGARSQVRNGI